MSTKKAVSDAELRRRHEVQLQNLDKARDVRQKKLAAKSPKRLQPVVKPKPYVKPAPSPPPPPPLIQKVQVDTSGFEHLLQEHPTTGEFFETFPSTASTKTSSNTQEKGSS